MALEVGTINRDTTYPFNDTGTGMAFALYQALKAYKVDLSKRDNLPAATGTVLVRGGRNLVLTAPDGSTFPALVSTTDPRRNKISIGTESRTVQQIIGTDTVIVDAFFPNNGYSGTYSTYNDYDNKPAHYAGTLAQWNALTPIEQWRVNIDYSINKQLDEQMRTALALANGLVPYVVANADVSVLIPSTLAGLQKLPTLIAPGELTAASGVDRTLSGGIQ